MINHCKGLIKGVSPFYLNTEQKTDLVYHGTIPGTEPIDSDSDWDDIGSDIELELLEDEYDATVQELVLRQEEEARRQKHKKIQDFKMKIEHTRSKYKEQIVHTSELEKKGGSSDPKMATKGLPNLKQDIKTKGAAAKEGVKERIQEYVHHIKGKFPELNENELIFVLELADNVDAARMPPGQYRDLVNAISSM